jgi:uncharacterized membrane protein YfhO
VEVDLWQPEFRRITVKAGRDDRLQVRTSNYPGWTAFIDGQAAEIKTGEAGMIVIDLPSGEHNVTLDFRSTPVRRIGGWITLLSSVIVFSLVARAKWKKRII